MIVVDTNLLVFASRADSPIHERAKDTIRGLAEGRRRWAIPYQCVAEFLAVVTSSRVFKVPTPAATALDQIDAWAESPSMDFVGEHSDFWPRFREFVVASGVTGPRIHDVRIAAVSAGVDAHAIWTADRDFESLPGPPAVNPLHDA